MKQVGSRVVQGVGATHDNDLECSLALPVQHVALANQFKTVHAVTLNAETGHAEALGSSRMPLDKNELLLSLQIAMKIADLGSTAEALEVNC